MSFLLLIYPREKCTGWKFGLHPDFPRIINYLQELYNYVIIISSDQSQKVLTLLTTVFRWEPEGRFRRRLYTEIQSFWFSTNHLWIALTPFWLSTDNDYVILSYSDKRKFMKNHQNLRKWCFISDLACSTSTPSLEQKYSSCWKILKSRYNAIA